MIPLHSSNAKEEAEWSDINIEFGSILLWQVSVNKITNSKKENGLKWHILILFSMIFFKQRNNSNGTGKCDI